MNKFKEYLKERNFSRYIFFIVFTATLLYIMYFMIKNINTVAGYGITGLSSVLGALSPLFTGLIIAYLINPLVEIIDTKVLQRLISRNPDQTLTSKQTRTSRYISIFATFIIIIAAIVALIYGFTALIVGKIVVESLPKMIQDGMNLIVSYEAEIKNWIAKLPDMPFSDQLGGYVDSIMRWITGNFSATTLIQKVGGISGGIFDFVVGLIISIYLIADKDYFKKIWADFLRLVFPKNVSSAIGESLGEVDTVLSLFIRGVMIDALAVAVLSSIGLSILGLDFAVFIGIFAGVANIIPYFGPIMGMVPAFVIGFFSEGFWHGVIAVGILLVVQQIDCNLIYPRVVGSSTGLKPLFVLLAVSIAGYYGGILGMILAVPIAGIIQVFVTKWAVKREATLAQRENAQNIDQQL
ncbi:MAG: AI-2E family transporter [Anaerovoracaceae bacterium]